MKKSLVMFSALVFAGCASTRIPPNSELKVTYYYTHPTYGEVSNEHEAYRQDFSDCESSLYAKGLVIDNEVVTDHQVIDQYLYEYQNWLLTGVLNTIQKATNKAKSDLSQASVAGALTASTGESVDVDNSNTLYEQSSTPMQFIEAEKYNNNLEQCVIDAGWKYSRLEKSYVLKDTLETKG